MIMHCTHALSRRLTGVSSQPLAQDSALGGWHAHIVRMDDGEAVIFCHDPSRYSLVLLRPGPQQFQHLGDWFADLLLQCLAAEGFDPAALATVARSLGTIQFDRATTPSVLGRVRSVSTQLCKRLAAGQLPDDREPTRASLALSHHPTTIGTRRVWPDKELAEMVQTLLAGGPGH